MTTNKMTRHINDARALRDRLKKEHRHFDAQVVQNIVLSAVMAQHKCREVHKEYIALRRQCSPKTYPEKEPKDG